MKPNMPQLPEIENYILIFSRFKHIGIVRFRMSDSSICKYYGTKGFKGKHAITDHKNR